MSRRPSPTRLPSPTPSSPTTTPATDPHLGGNRANRSSGRDSCQVSRIFPPRSRSPFPFRVVRTPREGVELSKIAPFAEDHHGLVTIAAAVRAGVSLSTWYRAVRSGAVEQLHSGVARLHGSTR